MMSEHPPTRRVARFGLAGIVPERWRNGGGWTRTVASAGDAGGLLWRLSAADIERDGPFSAFDGLDRTAVLMQGDGLALEGEGPVIRFDRCGDSAHFRGEAALRARLAGGPARLWNVMVRRGRLRAEVTVGTGAASDAMPAAIAEAIVVLAGRVRVCWPDGAPESVLAIDEGLVLTGRIRSPSIEPLNASPRAGDECPAAPAPTAAAQVARWIRTRILPTA